MPPLALYVHVPFCEVACRYCNFYFVARRPDLYDATVHAIRTEIERWAADPRVAGRPIETIYLGGGTPSVLSGEQIQAILADIHARYQVPPGAEVTLEANPGSLHDRKLAAFRQAGVTRLSIGVQSFHDDELRMIWRTHKAEEAIRSLESARQAGFDDINVDLMFAIPRQTMERWVATLEKAISLSPEHISTYCLTIEEGTPLAAHVASAKLARPEEELERELYLCAIELLESRGYEQYEISNFARDGRYSRHNLACWRRGEYVGVGPGAHSFLDPERWSNVRSVERYVRAVEAGQDAREMRETLGEDKARLEFLWLSLRTKWGLDLDAFGRRFREDLRDSRRDVVDGLLADGFASVEGGRLRLTRAGRVVADGITSRFV